jgi:hypothetical protein
MIMSPVTIPVNRKRFPYGAVILSYLTGLTIFWLASGNIGGAPIDTWRSRLVYLLLILFCLQAAIFAWTDYLHNVFAKDAGVFLSQDGIDDRSSIYSMGKIVWQDIGAVEIKRKFRINLLFIYLHDPNKYISEQVLWKRIALRRWLKRWGSPVVISQRRLNYDVHELKALLDSRRKGV